MKNVSSKCTLFIFWGTRRGDEGCSGLSSAGGVGVITDIQQKKLQKRLALQCKPCYNKVKQKHGREYQRARICYQQGARHTHPQEERKMRTCWLCREGEESMRYQGLVKNRLNGDIRRTRLYKTYKEAHHRAESLGKRVYGKNYNWEIDVITREGGSRD